LRLPNGKFRCKVVDNNAQGHAGLVEWLARHEAADVHVCKGSAGRSSLKPVPTGFSSRQGTALPFGRPAPSPLRSKP
jgi:hypothetical protein